MRAARLARRALPAAAVAAALALTATTALADDWGQRVSGTHVYDLAGVLTAAQVSYLERSAAAVDRAGAPTVVYLRRRDADDATTRQDARALMDAWDVESAPGAKDGFVLLCNLKPADARHGSAALVAGQSHAARLDAGRLQAVYDGTMKPRLAAGDLAAALSAALEQVAADLQEAPGPAEAAPPTQPQPVSPWVVAGSLLGFGGLVSVILVMLVLMARGGFPRLPPPGRRPRGGGPPWFGGGFTGGSGTFTGGDGGASSGSSSGGGSF